jgi:succinylarginine dihydrolase
MFVQQSPDAIDAGVFHNDVIAVGNGNALFVHEDAFVDQASLLDRIRFRFESFFDAPLYIIQVGASELSLADAVSSYLFNSQLITLPDGTMSLVYPTECDELGAARAVIDRVIAEDNPIASAHAVDVRQSMCNGGGPACLRLRIVLTGAELLRTHQGVFMTPELYDQLVAWVERHYRDALAPDDLRDVKLLEESHRTLDELTGLLELGSLYSFQR